MLLCNNKKICGLSPRGYSLCRYINPPIMGIFRLKSKPYTKGDCRLYMRKFDESERTFKALLIKYLNHQP